LLIEKFYGGKFFMDVTLLNAIEATLPKLRLFIEKQIQITGSPFYNALKTKSVENGGEFYKFPMSDSVNSSVQITSDEIATLAGGGVTPFSGVLDTVGIMGYLRISHKALNKKYDSNLSALKSLLSFQIEILIDTVKFYLERGVNLSSDNVLAEVVSVSGANVTVDNALFLKPNEGVSVYKTGSLVGSSVIKDIDYVNNVITLADVLTLTAGSKITTFAGLNKGMVGLNDIFATTAAKPSIYGIQKSEHKSLQSELLTAAGINPGDQHINDVMLQTVINRVQSTHRSKIDMIQTSDTGLLAYQQYLQEFNRNIQVMDLKGGFKSISFNGIPVVSSPFKAGLEIDFLDTSKFFLLKDGADGFADKNGNANGLLRSENQTAFSTQYIMYRNLGCVNPGGHGRLSGFLGAGEVVDNDAA
jgi:hypothetical protein